MHHPYVCKIFMVTKGGFEKNTLLDMFLVDGSDYANKGACVSCSACKTPDLPFKPIACKNISHDSVIVLFL